jgi:hypothetical protein
MKTLRAFVIALVTPALAFAGDLQAPPPIPRELPKAEASPYVLSGVRRAELDVSLAGSLDSNARTDAPADARTGRLSTVIGVDVGVPIWNQRIRPTLFVGAQLGYWGDDAHGVASGYAGARIRASMWMGDIWDVYAIARADFPMTGAGAAFRPGLGVGIRIARAIAFEGTWDMLIPIGNEFRNTQYTSIVPFGGTLAVSFDLCMSCNKPDQKPLDRNVACRLYNAAKTVSTCGVSSQICAAVPKAMAACPDALAATRDEDGASTFLKALEDGVTADAKIAVRRLVDLHAALLEQWGAYETKVAEAGVRGNKLAERWTYAPVPAELRSYLGCDGAAPPECVETAK